MLPKGGLLAFMAWIYNNFSHIKLSLKTIMFLWYFWNDSFIFIVTIYSNQKKFFCLMFEMIFWIIMNKAFWNVTQIQIVLYLHSFHILILKMLLPEQYICKALFLFRPLDCPSFLNFNYYRVFWCHFHLFHNISRTLYFLSFSSLTVP